MFKDTINVSQLFEQGHLVTELDEFNANRLLALVKKDNFIFEPHPPAGEAYKEKGFANRYTAHWDIEGLGVPRGYQRFAKELSQFFDPLMKDFLGGKSCDNVYVGVHKITEGYWMDWHQDISSKAPILVLCYLSEDDITAEDEGFIQVGKRTWNDLHADPVLETTGEVIGSHGKVLILDNVSPLFEHRVLPFKAPDKCRYLVSFNLNEKDSW